MRRLVTLIALSCALTACATAPAHISTTSPLVVDGHNLGSAPPPKMPELPASLAEKAKPLPPIPDGKTSTLVKALAETSRAYNDVATRLNAIIDAWNAARGGK